MENYKGYKLNYYPKSEHAAWDNRYQTFKARPYDDADYYWAYTYDKESWTIVYKGKVVQRLNGSFEMVVDLIEDQNKNIKQQIVHW